MALAERELMLAGRPNKKLDEESLEIGGLRWPTLSGGRGGVACGGGSCSRGSCGGGFEGLFGLFGLGGCSCGRCSWFDSSLFCFGTFCGRSGIGGRRSLWLRGGRGAVVVASNAGLLPFSGFVRFRYFTLEPLAFLNFLYTSKEITRFMMNL